MCGLKITGWTIKEKTINKSIYKKSQKKVFSELNLNKLINKTLMD